MDAESSGTTSEKDLLTLSYELSDAKREINDLKEAVKAFKWLSGILAVVVLLSWSSINDKNNRIEKYWERLAGIQEKARGLESSVSELRDAEDDFDDGFTDWKEVVPKVKELSDDVGRQAEEIQADIDQLEDDMRPPPPDPGD
jgi:chromosome segregation ATPase